MGSEEAQENKPNRVALFKTRDMQILHSRNSEITLIISSMLLLWRMISREEIQNCNYEVNMQIHLCIPGELAALTLTLLFLFPSSL